MKMENILRTVLNSLDERVAPAVQDEKAQAALRSVRHILAYLIAKDQPPPAEPNELPVHFIPGGPNAGVMPAARIADVGVPWNYFGGALYHQIDEAFEGKLSDAAVTEEVIECLAWERRAINRVVDQCNAVLSGARIGHLAESPELNIGVLQEFLRTRYSEPSLEVLKFRPFADGRSKLTGLLQIAKSSALSSEIVMRMDLPVSATRTPSVTSEYELLKVLYRRGLAVPEPLLSERGCAVLGAPFILMSKMEGKPASGLLGAPYSVKVARSLAAELGALHQVPLGELAGAVAQIDPPTLQDMSSELEQYEHSWREHNPEPSLTMRYALHWLRTNISLAVEGRAALTHRDALFHNVLADGDKMTALLDWEFVRVGFPAEDLGWIRASVERAMPWRKFMAAYKNSGGHDIPDAVVDYYSVWGSVRLGMMLTYSNWLLATGQVDDVDYSCAALRETHIARQWLSDNVARILERNGVRG